MEINKDFVPYEEAVALKELGFDEPCLAFWDAYNGMSHLFFKKRAKAHWLVRLFSKEDEGVSSYNQDSLEYFEDGSCLAPTFSQAFRWFRKNHKLNSEIHYLPNVEKYGIIVSNMNIKPKELSNKENFKRGVQVTNNFSKYDNYKEAELACLRKLIELVKKNKL